MITKHILNIFYRALQHTSQGHYGADGYKQVFHDEGSQLPAPSHCCEIIAIVYRSVYPKANFTRQGL